MKGQKEAVIEEVLGLLPNFVKYTDNAILMLSNAQLEVLKANIYIAIISGTVQYSKDITKTDEVRAYARSMVMNHLKKAKELNGGHVYAPANNDTVKTIRVKANVGPKGVNTELLTDELKAYVKTLV